MRKIFHLEIKSECSHRYYGSLSALCSENPNLGISKFTLDRFDFSEPFENGICIIRKSVMKTTGSVGEKKIKKNNISRGNLAGYLTGKAKNKTGLIYVTEAVR